MKRARRSRATFLKPVQAALGSLGSIFGWVLAVMIVLGAIIAPVAGIVWVGRKVNRRHQLVRETID